MWNLTVGGTLAIVFAFLLGRSVIELFRASASTEWLQVDGEVFQARMVRTARRGWLPDIRYTYRLGDKEFIGRRLAFGREYWHFKGAGERAVARHPAGRAVTVYVHPHRATLCVLEPGVRWFNYANVGYTALLLGCIVAFVLFR
jgi:hypothetical protein